MPFSRRRHHEINRTSRPVRRAFGEQLLDFGRALPSAITHRHPAEEVACGSAGEVAQTGAKFDRLVSGPSQCAQPARALALAASEIPVSVDVGPTRRSPSRATRQD